MIKICRFVASPDPQEGDLTLYFCHCAIQIYLNRFKKDKRAPRRTPLYALIIIGIMTKLGIQSIRIFGPYLL